MRRQKTGRRVTRGRGETQPDPCHRNSIPPLPLNVGPARKSLAQSFTSLRWEIMLLHVILRPETTV